MNTLKKYTMIGTLALAMALTGCNKGPPAMVLERNVSEANGYDVLVCYRNCDDVMMNIGKCKVDKYKNGEERFSGFSEVIQADVRYGRGVYQMTLSGVGKGSKLEELASAQKVQEIYEKFRERHKRN